MYQVSDLYAAPFLVSFFRQGKGRQGEELWSLWSLWSLWTYPVDDLLLPGGRSHLSYITTVQLALLSLSSSTLSTI